LGSNLLENMLGVVGKSRLKGEVVLGVCAKVGRGACCFCWILDLSVDGIRVLWKSFDVSARYAAVVAAFCA
jgi:hypothetical protein